MLPDRKKWSEEFVRSDQYAKILTQIDSFPAPEFEAYWDAWEESRFDIERRHFMYLRRVVSLCSLYPIDYIHHATGGQRIVNICRGNNYFAGMYNITTVSGSKSFINNTEVTPSKLYLAYNKSFENALSICDFQHTSISKLKNDIMGFIDLVVPGGYGYIAIDSVRMIMNAKEADIDSLELKKYYRCMMYIDDSVERATKNVDVLYYENLLDSLEHRNPVDGTLRLFFKTRPSEEV